MTLLFSVLVLVGVMSQNEKFKEAPKKTEVSQVEAAVWTGEIKLRKARPEEISK